MAAEACLLAVANASNKGAEEKCADVCSYNGGTYRGAGQDTGNEANKGTHYRQDNGAKCNLFKTFKDAHSR